MTTLTLPFFAGGWWPRTRALWQRLVHMGRRNARGLHLRESLALGERRFVAVIEYENRRLLIGGTPSSLVLLAHLGAAAAPRQRAEDLAASAGLESPELQELHGWPQGQERMRIRW